MLRYGTIPALLFAGLMYTTAHAATAEGQVSANVVEQLTIQNSQPLNFGFITPNGSGSVSISTNNQRTTSGGVEVKDAFSRGAYHVKGAPGRAYSISMPSSQLFVSSAANSDASLTNSLTVSNFRVRSMNTANNNGQLNSNGEDTVYLGGTIDVPSNAVPGVYSGVVTITVSY